MNEAREFGLFIDGLRIERNMSREDLCEGVMSLSQYKRYLRGDTSIPNSKLVMIADRLKFSINDIHFLFRQKHNDEYNSINKIYNLIKANSVQEAYNLAIKYTKTAFLSEYNKLFFDFCFISIQYRLKMVSSVHVLDMYSRLIDYPECSNNDSFNMIEISALIQICIISSKMDNLEPSNTLYRLLSSPSFNYSSASESTFLPSIYSSLSRILYMQKDYEKVIDITKIGIDYCLALETSNAFPHMLLFNSLSNIKLGNFDDGIESAKKCFMLLYVENKKANFESFKQNFEKQSELKLSEIINFM